MKTLAAPFAAQPQPSLVLQLQPEEGDLTRVGPDAEILNRTAVKTIQEDQRSFLRIKAPGAEQRKSRPEPILQWDADALLNNAQGAVSFRMRFTPATEPSKNLQPLIRIRETGGGTWALPLEEAKSVPDTDKDVLHREVALPDEVEEDLETDSDPDGDASMKLKEEETYLNGGMQLRYFGRSGILPKEQMPRRRGGTWFKSKSGLTGGTKIRNKFQEKGKWHHIVYIWRSVNHFLYVDGKLAASFYGVSRLEPMDSKDALLEILNATDGDIADLRFYNRALDRDEITLLNRAETDQYLPEPPPLRIWTDWGKLTGRAVVYTDTRRIPADKIIYSCVNADTDKTLKTFSATDFPSGLGEEAVTIFDSGPFPEGKYRFTATAYNDKGKKLAHTKGNLMERKESEETWLGSEAGLGDEPEILPPFEPIEFANEKEVTTVLRDHQIHRTGLFNSITAKNSMTGKTGELLDAPVQLNVKRGDKTLQFSEGPGLISRKNHKDTAEWSARTVSPDGHALKVEGEMQYDGLAKFKVTFTPNEELSVDGVRLQVPLRAEVFKLIHTNTSISPGMRSDFYRIATSGEGDYKAHPINWCSSRESHRSNVILDSFDVFAYRNFDPFHFTPYVHVGNNYRGLSWFATNDKGWVHNVPDVPPMEIVATDEKQAMRFNVISREKTLTNPVKFSFCMLANPIKPLPDDWRTWVIADHRTEGNKVQQHTEHQFWWLWGAYARNFYPYPGGTKGKTYEDWIGAFKGDEVYNCPFINYGVAAGSGLAKRPESQVKPFGWKLHNNRPFQDYMTYWLNKCVKEVGIKGVYVDEPYSEQGTYNLLAGDQAYLRSDGTRRLGYRYLEGRRYIRRLKRMLVENDIQTGLWMHTTNFKALPILSFVDISMDGEHPQIWTKQVTNYHKHYNGRRSRGYISGLPYGFVGSQMYKSHQDPESRNRVYRANRTYLACTLPYKVRPMKMSLSDEQDRLQNIRYKFGIFDDNLQMLDVYKENDWAPSTEIPDDLDLSGVLHPERNQALLYAVSRSKRTRFALNGGFQEMALNKKYRHAWDAETGKSLMVDGEINLDLYPGDLGVMLVRGASSPQASRPEGTILGASFDEGINPDFGGGIAPAETSASPSLVAGQQGKALAISQPQSSVAYPVVPSWAAGSVEFDIRIQKFPNQPLQLLTLKHHLDTELAYREKNGKKGLVLTTREMAPSGSDEENAPPAPVKRSTFCPLPENAGNGWAHLTLVWRAGQYEVYWNAKRIGKIMKPAEPRFRDDTVLSNGVRVGDPDVGSSNGQILLDNVLVYDWPLRESDVRGDTSEDQLQNATPSSPVDPFRTWVWDIDQEELAVQVYFQNQEKWQTINGIKVSVTKEGNDEEPLATQKVFPWKGTATARLHVSQAKEVDSDKIMSLTDSGSDSGDDTGQKYLIQIELKDRKETVAKREVEFTVDSTDAILNEGPVGKSYD